LFVSTRGTQSRAAPVAVACRIVGANAARRKSDASRPVGRE
jgi:hypothetical protein